MSDNNGWPDPVFRFGVPLNPERDQFHWLIRKNGQCPEAWRWDPDADGCGTEYSGAWAESEGDGQPEDMGKWYRYLGPCLTPAEVESHKYAAVIAYANLLNLPAPPNLVAQARRDALEEAAKIADSCAADWTKSAKGKYLETKWDYESRADAGEEIAAAIRALGENE